MRCRDARNFWGGAAAAMILICKGSGCVTVPAVDRTPCTPLAACSPLVVCSTPCVPASASAMSATSSLNQTQGSLAPSATTERPAVSIPTFFPPQTVVETGNYREFVSANEKQLQSCKQEGAGCDVALFNLGFVYAYETSPYRNLDKAATYFEELVTRYPESPYALPGKAWRALIRERLTLEGDLRTVKTHLRGKEATIRTLQEQLQRLRELEIEMQEKERELLQLR